MIVFPEELLEIITRLDDYGKINADLTEVTVITTNREKENPPPKPLAEVVESVAQHQEAGFSPTTDDNLSQNPEISTGKTKKDGKNADVRYSDATAKSPENRIERKNHSKICA